MNREQESYQLPYIYDCLLSAVVTPGGQSFRRRQRNVSNNQIKGYIIDKFTWLIEQPFQTMSLFEDETFRVFLFLITITWIQEAMSRILKQIAVEIWLVGRSTTLHRSEKFYRNSSMNSVLRYAANCLTANKHMDWIVIERQSTKDNGSPPISSQFIFGP